MKAKEVKLLEMRLRNTYKEAYNYVSKCFRLDTKGQIASHNGFNKDLYRAKFHLTSDFVKGLRDLEELKINVKEEE